jgi:predicted nucleic acid-binding protein
MTTIVDTNIILALLDPADQHHAWAAGEIVVRKALGPAIIPDIVYCEVSVGMGSQADLDEAIKKLDLEREPESDAALFRAGRAFNDYRKTNKGPKLGVLPDFLIGAHAEAANLPLMTANPKDFTGYFPTVVLIQP